MTLNNQELTNGNLLNIGIESLNIESNFKITNHFNNFGVPVHFNESDLIQVKEKPKKREVNKISVADEGEFYKVNIQHPITLLINKNDKILMSYEILKLIDSGNLKISEASKLFGIHRNTIGEQKKKFDEEGINGLMDKRNKGNSKKITQKVINEILKAQIRDFKKTSKEISDELKEQNIKISQRTIRTVLDDYGFNKLKKEMVIEEPKDLKHNPKSRMTTKEVFEFECGKGINSRFALGLLHNPYLEIVGFYKLIKPLNLNRNGKYTHSDIFNTLYFSSVFGYNRLFNVDYIPQDEFSVLLENSNTPGKSLMHNYIDEISKTKDVEKFKMNTFKSFAEKDLIDGRIIYIDSHTVESFSDKNIGMFMHGTKNKLVKCFKVHYSIDAIKNRPMMFEFTDSSIDIRKIVLPLLEKSDEILSSTGREVEMVVFDRGAFDVGLWKEINKIGKIFICWSKDLNTINRELDAVPDELFFNPSRERLNFDGKSIEKVADTETYLNGWGNIRTIVIENKNIKRRIAFYTNAEKKDYDTLTLINILRRRQNIEDFLKDKKNDLSADAFCGGAIEPVDVNEMKPNKKEVEKMEGKLKRGEKRLMMLTKELENLFDLYDTRVIRKREYKMLKKDKERKIKNKKKEIWKYNGLIKWYYCGEVPEGIKPIYKINTDKIQVLNIVKDIAYVINSMITEELCSYSGDDKFKNMTVSTMRDKLYYQGGEVKIDDDGFMQVEAKEFRDVRLYDAYQKLFCERRNKSPVYNKGEHWVKYT